MRPLRLAPDLILVPVAVRSNGISVDCCREVRKGDDDYERYAAEADALAAVRAGAHATVSLPTRGWGDSGHLAHSPTEAGHTWGSKPGVPHGGEFVKGVGRLIEGKEEVRSSRQTPQGQQHPGADRIDGKYWRDRTQISTAQERYQPYEDETKAIPAEFMRYLARTGAVKQMYVGTGPPERIPGVPPGHNAEARVIAFYAGRDKFISLSVGEPDSPHKPDGTLIHELAHAVDYDGAFEPQASKAPAFLQLRRKIMKLERERKLLFRRYAHETPQEFFAELFTAWVKQDWAYFFPWLGPKTMEELIPQVNEFFENLRKKIAKRHPETAGAPAANVGA